MLSAADIYERLVDEEDARACRDIPEAACREVPRSFTRMLAAQVLTKLGDALISPKTVLAWIMSGVGAPVALTSLLVPIRESGSLIPQLLIAGWVRRLPVRKRAWVTGAVVQGAVVIGMGLSALVLDGMAAGGAIVSLLVLFSLARGLCSVAAKDVLGKTIPKRRRGQLTGWSTGAAGLMAIVVGGALTLAESNGGAAWLYGALVVSAGLLWFAGATVYGGIAEHAGETDGGRNGFRAARERLGILQDDAPFRRFVITRALLLCSALTAPYYVLLARDLSGDGPMLLGLFVVSAGLADMLAAPIWGRLADRSSRVVMSAAGFVTALLGVAVFVAVEFLPSAAGTLAFFPIAYFLLSVAHAGVRVGRKTYVVDLAGGNKRTDYVSVSNTVIGVVLLVAGASSALLSLVSVPVILLALSLAGLAGAWLALSLPEAE